MTKKKIAVFTGAGVSKESGVDTFRDAKDGLWENHKIADVASITGWFADPSKVLGFYNERRRQLPTVHPNKAHRLIAELENYFDVTVITQNVDDLHERGGSNNILHLHGELTKAKSSHRTGKAGYDITDSVDIGYEDIKLGDLCEENKAQMRPDIVWFGEYPYMVDRAYQAVRNADILLIIGTSLEITYTIDMLQNAKTDCEIIYIDPSPSTILDRYSMNVTYLKKPAVEGVGEVANRLMNEAMLKEEE